RLDILLSRATLTMLRAILRLDGFVGFQ
ncbi:hypothetical protein LCGC14_2402560, partial [marine sediment metagenome]